MDGRYGFAVHARRKQCGVQHILQRDALFIVVVRRRRRRIVPLGRDEPSTCAHSQVERVQQISQANPLPRDLGHPAAAPLRARCHGGSRVEGAAVACALQHCDRQGLLEPDEFRQAHRPRRHHEAAQLEVPAVGWVRSQSQGPGQELVVAHEHVLFRRQRMLPQQLDRSLQDRRLGVVDDHSGVLPDGGQELLRFLRRGRNSCQRKKLNPCRDPAQPSQKPSAAEQSRPRPGTVRSHTQRRARQPILKRSTVFDRQPGEILTRMAFSAIF